MSGPELKRCFECGATYPVAELVCPSDKTPLSFDTVGRRWKIQALIGLRPGGAVFEATHLIHGTRAALDLLPGSNAREVDFEARMQKQLQALRLLDKNKHILPLIEDGTERDGSRFFVTELQAARHLADVLIEARKPLAATGEGTGEVRAALEPAAAAQLIRQLAGLLSTTHRIGIGHGAIDPTQVYVLGEAAAPVSLSSTTQLRLHGLQAIGLGPVLREAIAADVRALCALLAELVLGSPPPQDAGALRDAVTAAFAGPAAALGAVVLRGLQAEPPPIASADELQRVLSAASSGAAAPEPEPALPKASSAPSLPSLPSLPPEFRSVPPGRSLPPVRVTSQHAALPLTPVAQGPQRSGLTSELRQVSILDLMREREQAGGTAQGGFTDVVEVNTPPASKPGPGRDEEDESFPAIQLEAMPSQPSVPPQTEPPAAAPPAVAAPAAEAADLEKASPAPSHRSPAAPAAASATSPPGPVGGPAAAPLSPSARSQREPEAPSHRSQREPLPASATSQRDRVPLSAAIEPAPVVPAPTAAEPAPPTPPQALAPPAPQAFAARDLPRWVWLLILAAVAVLAVAAGLLSS
jgi:hypothetical protein